MVPKTKWAWGTIRFAVEGGWGTTLRLMAVLAVLVGSGPVFIVWAVLRVRG